MEKSFYEKVKLNFNLPSLTQGMVDGFELIAKHWATLKQKDIRLLAYIYATAWHETGKRMQPIAERGSGKDVNKNGQDDHFDKYDQRTDLGNTPKMDGDGSKWKGRGYVQITGKTNYLTFSKVLKKPLIENPELACDPDIAAEIIVTGMLRGLFTGKSLTYYINQNRCDYNNARRVVNGMDCHDKIAQYAIKFQQALK